MSWDKQQLSNWGKGFKPGLSIDSRTSIDSLESSQTIGRIRKSWLHTVTRPPPSRGTLCRPTDWHREVVRWHQRQRMALLVQPPRQFLASGYVCYVTCVRLKCHFDMPMLCILLWTPKWLANGRASPKKCLAVLDSSHILDFGNSLQTADGKQQCATAMKALQLFIPHPCDRSTCHWRVVHSTSCPSSGTWMHWPTFQSFGIVPMLLPSAFSPKPEMFLR